MIGRQIKTRIPCRDIALRDINIDDKIVQDANHEQKYISKSVYDRLTSAQPLHDLKPDTDVRLRRDGSWSPNKYTVVGKASTPRSYIIRDQETGRSFRRNRRQLLPTPVELPKDQSDKLITPSDVTDGAASDNSRPKRVSKLPAKYADYDMRR